eukprot:3298373-Prymnesium_polylepis.1
MVAEEEVMAVERVMVTKPEGMREREKDQRSDLTNPLTTCILPETVYQADDFWTLTGQNVDLGPDRVEVWGRCITSQDASG